MLAWTKHMLLSYFLFGICLLIENMSLSQIPTLTSVTLDLDINIELHAKYLKNS